MKIILIGSSGQLGRDLTNFLNKDELIPLNHTDIEIKNYSQVKKIIRDYLPDVIINTAAYHKVEECEKNFKEAFLVNSFAIKNLASVCLQYDVSLVHFSTDYVFSGTKKTPYKENDTPQPLNVYGISKLAGEYFIKYILKKYFLIRTSGLFGKGGSKQKGGNFVDIILRKARNNEEIRVVGDLFFSPTYTHHLTFAVEKLIRKKCYGTYHITNSGYCSWYEFAKKILEIKKIKADLKEIKYNDLGTKLVRPKYSVLSNSKIQKSLGIKIKNWQDALLQYLKE